MRTIREKERTRKYAKTYKTTIENIHDQYRENEKEKEYT